MEYLNVNNSVNTISYPDGTYSWMRVLAGAKGSEFNGIKMNADLDMNGFDILNSGGSSGGILKDSVIWRTTGTAEEGVVIGTNATLINDYITANTNIKYVLVDGIKEITTPIYCLGRACFYNFNSNNGNTLGRVSIHFSGQGAIIDCPEFKNLSLTADVGLTSPALWYTLTGIDSAFGVSFDNVYSTNDSTFETIQLQPPSAGKTCNFTFTNFTEIYGINIFNKIGGGGVATKCVVSNFSKLGTVSTDTAFSGPSNYAVAVDSSSTVPLVAQTNNVGGFYSILYVDSPTNVRMINQPYANNVTPADKVFSSLIGISVGDNLRYLNYLSSYTYANYITNTLENSFVVAEKQELNFAPATSTLYKFGDDASAPSFTNVNFRSIVSDMCNASYDCHFVFRIIANPAPHVAKIGVSLRVDGLTEDSGITIVEIPAVGESVIIPLKALVFHWPSGGFLARVNVECDTAGVQISCDNASGTIRPISMMMGVPPPG